MAASCGKLVNFPADIAVVMMLLLHQYPIKLALVSHSLVIMVGKNNIIVPIKTVKGGCVAVHEYIRGIVPSKTFGKTNAKGATWVADLRACPLSKKDINLIRDVFDDKPWLTLLFEPMPSMVSPAAEPVVIDLLTPVKEKSVSVATKAFSVDSDDEASATKKQVTFPVMGTATIKAKMQQRDIQRSLVRIKKEVDFLDLVFNTKGQTESNEAKDPLTKAEIDAENLLFALRNECKQLPEEVVFSMEVLATSLRNKRDICAPFHCDESKIAAALPTPISISIPSKADDGKHDDVYSQPNNKDYLFDKTAENDGSCTSEGTVDPDNSVSYLTALDEVNPDVDGEVVVDEFLQDDFAETQPE